MKNLIITSLLLLCALVLNAKLTMGPLFSNGMVLQQKESVNIWGWSDAGAKVSITTSWGAKATAQADQKGVWRTKIQTPEATFTPQNLQITSGKDKVQIQDVLIGEVWFASGQSNMEMPLKGFDSCPTEGSNEAISLAGKYSGKVHFVTVPTSPQKLPTDTVTVKWENCTAQTAGSFCAAAYFFGIHLQESLNVPVGLINSSLGATRVEGWTPEELLRNYPDIDLSEKVFKDVGNIPDPYNIQRDLPLVFYNGMIHPFVGYGIKGFLWYQGEANVTYQADKYAERFTNMVREWRQRWGMGDLPFYYVEIAPYEYWWAKPPIFSCFLREQQFKAQSMLPNMGMVCSNDLVHDYEYWQIHPCMKKEVGDRLCYWALAEAYGISSVHCKSPSYKSMAIEGNKIMITFDNAENGLDRNVKIEGFEICGPDSVFHKAHVGTSGNRVSVQANEVKEPVAVRYCYKPWQLGNLKSNYGLPVIPFRTDDFPLK